MNAKFRRMMMGLGTLAAMWAMNGAAAASEASTSATAGGRTNGLNGNATATAQYTGDVGFARTDSRSGRVNLARGVAVGVDQDGVSLSVSNAIAPRFGPALATNFNMTIGPDGVNTSGGVALADGPLHRTATAGGSTGPLGATSVASADTDRFGRADASTWSDSSRNARRGPVLLAQPAPVRSQVGHVTAKRVQVIRHAVPVRR